MAEHKTYSPEGNADELQRAALAHLWMPTQHWADIAEDGIGILTEGSGIKVKDIHGKWSYDARAGLMLVNIGHGRREVVDAIARQLATLHYADTFQYGTPQMIRFAEKLASLTPGDLNRVYFTSGGSESVETALKIAYQYHANRGEPGRTKFIARRDSYHGVSRGALSVGTARILHREQWEPVLPGNVRFAPQPSFYHDESGSATASETAIRCAEAIEAIIVEEGADTVAAVIAEPVSFSAGVAVPGPEYWPMLRDICDCHGVLLIADEVITGFGRTGRWFGVEHWGVVPDLMTLAKAMTSGYFPVGACVARDSVFDAFKNGPDSTYMHGITFGGHPAGGAAGLANVDIMEREDLIGNSERMGARMLDGLNELRSHRTVGDVRGLGLMCALELVHDRATKAPISEIAGANKALSDKLVELGLLTRVAGANVFLAPPLTVTSEEVDDMVRIVDEAVTHMEEVVGLA